MIGSEEVFGEVLDDNGQVTQVSIRIPSKTDDNGRVTQVSSELVFKVFHKPDEPDIGVVKVNGTSQLAELLRRSELSGPDMVAGWSGT